MKTSVAALAIFLCLFLPFPVQAQSRPEFHVLHAEQPPKIDGDLSDSVWDDDPLVTGDWVSYNPLYGTKMPQRTEVRIAYDDRNLYFAFHFLVRAIEQFDSSRRRLLTDLLASYEFVPGTVFHAGYGSLYEKPAGDERYITTSRGLFFKASYLHRF